MSLLVFSNLKILIVLISSYPFSSLNLVIKVITPGHSLTYGNLESILQPENNLFRQHDHTIDSYRLTHFDFAPVLSHYIVYSYL